MLEEVHQYLSNTCDVNVTDHVPRVWPPLEGGLYNSRSGRQAVLRDRHEVQNRKTHQGLDRSIPNNLGFSFLRLVRVASRCQHLLRVNEYLYDGSVDPEMNG